MVKLVYHGELRHVVGVAEEDIDADTIKDVFRHISDTYGKEACGMAKSGLVALNEKRVTGVSVRIPAGSVVGFYSFCSGG
ncbi:MAG: hypothetical protein FWE08_06780 [Oscillospiraceae bacterium]|nr:hypothetical protein [Oscillospiraceae bacterium]